jgi:hypothetical protein
MYTVVGGFGAGGAFASPVVKAAGVTRLLSRVRAPSQTDAKPNEVGSCRRGKTTERVSLALQGEANLSEVCFDENIRLRRYIVTH